MKTLFFALIIALTFYSSLAQAQNENTRLEIKVLKHVYGDKEPRPFIGVGAFDLFRGKSKLEGASCSSASGAAGNVDCIIPCQKNHNLSTTIYIKPPSDQDHLAGWVTPAQKSVELVGCKLAPKIVTMSYVDAKYALNKVIDNIIEPNLSKRSKNLYLIGVHDLSESDRSKVKESFISAASSEKGRTNLINIYRYASQNFNSYLTPGKEISEIEANEMRSFANWKVLSASSLLSEKVKRVIPENLHTAAKPIQATHDVALYRTSLDKANLMLTEIKRKDIDQLKLFDDVKMLRSIAMLSKDDDDAIKIIKEWR